MKKIMIIGATGSIGSKLCDKLQSQGDEVTVFTRNSDNAKIILPDVKNFIEWNYNEPEVWKNELNGKDAIVHLAGANLGAKRWSEKYKKLCYDSRVISTRKLVEALRFVDQKPKVFICSSAVGYYGNRNDEVLDESSLSADNYLGKLCRDWEAEAAKVEEIGIRRVSVRTGLVLNKNEGLIKQMLPTFKMFLGGYLANGKQWFPWIHIDDIVGIYLHAIENERLRGAINGASPGIVRNEEFSKTLGKVMNRPSLFPIPKFALKLVTGELGEYAVMGQRTSVEKIIKSGYRFMFENLEEALKNIIKSE